MRDDYAAQSALLDDLLLRWHRWASQEQHAAGYPHECPSCKFWRASRQYDDSNGSLDAHVDDVLMQGIDIVIERIGQPHNTALAVYARNLSADAKGAPRVWTSARLPADREAVAAILLDAREMLSVELRRVGLL